MACIVDVPYEIGLKLAVKSEISDIMAEVNLDLVSLLSTVTWL